MDIRNLRHFVTLLRRGSFVAAAEELNLTQPALSRSIRGLEDEIGQKLIVRHRNGCVASPAGEMLLRDAEDILERMVMMKRNVQAFTQGRLGHLRFGIAPLPAALFLPRMLTRISNEQPGMSVSVSLGSPSSMLEKLRSDQIEFFICSKARVPRDELLAVTPLLHVPLTWLARAGHPLAQQKNVMFDMLSGYPIVGVRSDFSMPRDGIPDTMLDTPLAIACDDYQVLFSTVAHCDAVCLASSVVLTSHPDLVALDVVDMPVAKKIDIVAVHRRGRALSPAMQLMLQRKSFIIDVGDKPVGRSAGHA